MLFQTINSSFERTITKFERIKTILIKDRKQKICCLKACGLVTLASWYLRTEDVPMPSAAGTFSCWSQLTYRVPSSLILLLGQTETFILFLEMSKKSMLPQLLAH